MLAAGSRSRSPGTSFLYVEKQNPQRYAASSVDVVVRSTFTIKTLRKCTRESSLPKNLVTKSPQQDKKASRIQEKPSIFLQLPLVHDPKSMYQTTGKSASKESELEGSINELSTKSNTKDSGDQEKLHLFIKKRRQKPSQNKPRKEMERSPSREIGNHNYFQFSSLDPSSEPFKCWKEAARTLKYLHTDKFVFEPVLPRIPDIASIIKPVLVLDLDETLIHCCNFDNGKIKWDRTLTYESFRSGSTVVVKFNVRPHASWFIEQASRHFQIVIYTSSDQDYAKALVRFLDPSEKFIKRIYAKNLCLKTEKGFLVKDLRLVTGDDTSRVVLVDNAVSSFAPQINNGIPILPYYSGNVDQELPKLLNLLLVLKQEPIFSVFLKRYFGLSKLVKCHNDIDILNHLEGVGAEYR